MACAQREPDFLRLLGRFGDDFPQRRQQLAQLSALPACLVKAPEEGRQFPARHILARGSFLGQVVDALLDPQTFGVELKRAGIAVGHDRLHLASRKRRTFRHRLGERPDSLQEFPVVGHQKAIICRLPTRGLWAERPILPGSGS